MITRIARVSKGDESEWLRQSMENRINYFCLGRRLYHINSTEIHCEGDFELIVRCVSIITIVVPILQLIAYAALMIERKSFTINREKSLDYGSCKSTSLTLPKLIDTLDIELGNKQKEMSLILEYINSHKALRDMVLQKQAENRDFISNPTFQEIDGDPDDLRTKRRTLERSILEVVHYLNEIFYFLSTTSDLKASFFEHLENETPYKREKIVKMLPANLRSEYE